MLNCRLTCPKGVNFEFPPAEIYTCAYATGEFSPKQVPKCAYGELWLLTRNVFNSMNSIEAPGMQVVQSKPIMQYSQTNGTLIKTGGGKKVIVEADSGEDEEIEETQTIIKKTIIRKKGKKTYVRFRKFKKRKVHRGGECMRKLCPCLNCAEVAKVAARLGGNFY